MRKTASLPIYTATICQKKTDYCCSNSTEINVISKNNGGISQDFTENGGGGPHRTFLPLDTELLPKYPRFGMFFGGKIYYIVLGYKHEPNRLLH